MEKTPRVQLVLNLGDEVCVCGGAGGLWTGAHKVHLLTPLAGTVTKFLLWRLQKPNEPHILKATKSGCCRPKSAA